MTKRDTAGVRRGVRPSRGWSIAAAAVAAVASAWLWHHNAATPQTSGARMAPESPTPAMTMPGMDASSAAPSGSMVRLTTNELRQFGVTFGTVAVRMLEDKARTVGVVTVDSAGLVQVTPRFSGYVERLYANTAGQWVRHGQPLLDVYSPELVAAQQELLVASDLQHSLGTTDVPGVPLSGRTDLASAARERLALWGISDAQISAILRNGRPRRALTLYAPASGVVLEKAVVQGQAIQRGQMLYTIADLANVWVDAQLREEDAGDVRVGAGAHIDVAALPGRTFTGRVAYVYPTLDPGARTLRARISVTNSAGVLRPGMYATVTLASPSNRALTVPSSAVIRTGERNLVFVDAGGGRLQPREITVGRAAGDFTEVVSGLSPGERVVTSAQFLLDAESNLGEVMRSMIGQGAMSGTMSGADSSMSNMPGMDMGAGATAPMNTPRGAPMSDKGADMRRMPGMQGTRGMSKSTSPSAPSHATPRR